MRGFGVIAGILLSILGGYAFFMEMDMFIRLGWLLGIVIVMNGAVLIIPAIREKIQEKKILGGISIGVGFVIFLSGVTKTLTDVSLVYLAGSLVMFYGVIQLSAITKEKKKEGQATKIVCCVISLVIGALAVCHNFMETVTIDKLISYNLVMQGVNCVVLALDIHKKKIG